VKPSILRSFETLIKGMDPSPEPEPPPEEERAKPQVRAKQQNSPRMVVAEGEFLGRKWQVYSDGAFEGETVAGMEVFRDLEHFKGFVEDSPLLRSERAVPEEPASEAPPEPVSADGTPAETPARDAVLAARPAAKSGSDADSLAPLRRSKTDFARDLLIAGVLGVVLCAAWWIRSYSGDLHAELLRRGLSATAIRATKLSWLDRLGCLFANTDGCAAVKDWGRFAGHVPYEPAFLWLSLCALALGTWLVLLRRRSRSRSLET
jgi:hypothetical protein